MAIPMSVALFVLAGLCQIGGGYLVWQWLREGKPIGYALVRSHDSSTLRDHSHLSTGSLRTSVCGVWRNVYCPFPPVGG